jgi:hypothetical protein
VKERNSNLSKSRKYTPEGSLLNEAKTFGRFLRESFQQMGNLQKNMCCIAGNVNKSELTRVVKHHPTRVSIDLIDDPYV